MEDDFGKPETKQGGGRSLTDSGVSVQPEGRQSMSTGSKDELGSEEEGSNVGVRQ